MNGAFRGHSEMAPPKHFLTKIFSRREKFWDHYPGSWKMKKISLKWLFSTLSSKKFREFDYFKKIGIITLLSLFSHHFHCITLINPKKSKSFHYFHIVFIALLWLFRNYQIHCMNFIIFTSFSLHESDYSKKIKIIPLLSLLSHYFHCMNLIGRAHTLLKVKVLILLFSLILCSMTCFLFLIMR